MNRFWGHARTINKHKYKVSLLCFKCGLYTQGCLHDLSKYSWVEFSAGVKYFQGNRSPIDKEKETLGYSLGWLHHKGRNKHHWEYWLDNGSEGVIALEIPTRYVVEMFCDRISASQIYQKDAYRDDSALQYYNAGRHAIQIHPNSDALITYLLTHVRDHGLDETIQHIKKDILKKPY